MSDLIFKPEDFGLTYMDNCGRGFGFSDRAKKAIANQANQKYQEWKAGLSVVYLGSRGMQRYWSEYEYDETLTEQTHKAHIFGKSEIKEECQHKKVSIELDTDVYICDHCNKRLRHLGWEVFDDQ